MDNLLRTQIYETLDQYVRDGNWKLRVYEDSYEIIEWHYPHISLTEAELEEVTYDWFNYHKTEEYDV